MRGNNLFEYAVVRYVPRPEREEFLNIGVVLFCAAQNFLDARFSPAERRIRAFYEAADMAEIIQLLNAFEAICCGRATSSPISGLNKAGRFRWLTATRSTIIQTSKVHPGFCDDPAERLAQLYGELVL